MPRSKLATYFDLNYQSLEENYPGVTRKLLDEALSYYLANSDLGVQGFLEELATGVPLEYINNRAYFYNDWLYVDQNVLIPRFETEILVEKALEYIKNSGKTELRIADIGTGSGAIAVALAKEFSALAIKEAHFYLTDISEEALIVAKENTKDLAQVCDYKCSFTYKLGDRLTPLISHGPFDLILSNPPYIPQAMKENVHQNVLKYEPALALFLKDREYKEWFGTFFQSLAPLLSSDGLFICEGHEDYLDQLNEVFRVYNEGSEIICDYTGAKRFLSYQKRGFSHG